MTPGLFGALALALKDLGPRFGFRRFLGLRLCRLITFRLLTFLRDGFLFRTLPATMTIVCYLLTGLGSQCPKHCNFGC